MTNRNPLLLTDVYKLGHMIQYPEDTTEVYSYLEARKPNQKTVFFGLSYYLQEYLSQPITTFHAEQFFKYYKRILGSVPESVVQKINLLVERGYWPVEIKAVEEGTVLDSKNILFSIRNTEPEFYWCVGFLESLLLKVWNTSTVATCSLKYKELVERYAELTCDNGFHLPFQVHDFGYRGVSSEETAELSGAGHLLSFFGTDTVPAVAFLDEHYTPESEETIIGVSVPATEHSVMCSFGRENEFEAFDNMLRLHPTGIVSIVSDTYDLWNVLENYAKSRFDTIMNRDGKLVFRPDSGDPVKIICGDPESDNPLAREGALEILWRIFGGTINEKGFKVLDPHVGLIYGDGMYFERFEMMLETMKEKGFASSNLVIGVGGLLLQNHNRDEFGYSLKATHIIRHSTGSVNIYKDPITDPGKKSKCGFMKLDYCSETNKFVTIDQVTPEEEKTGLLQPVFRNGKVLKRYSLEQLRGNIEKTRNLDAVKGLDYADSV